MSTLSIDVHHYLEPSVLAILQHLATTGASIMSALDDIKTDLDATKTDLAAVKDAIAKFVDQSATITDLQKQIDALTAGDALSAQQIADLKTSADDLKTSADALAASVAPPSA